MDADSFAQGPAHQVRHALDQLVRVQRLGGQRLAAGEGQQPLGECGRALGARHGVVEGAAHAGVRRHPEPARDDLEIAGDDLEQVVEVVGDPAGELADGLHLLALAQRVVGLLAFGHRSGHPILQRRVQGRELLRLLVEFGVQSHDPSDGALQFGVQPLAFFLPGFKCGEALQQFLVLGAHLGMGIASPARRELAAGVAQDGRRDGRRAARQAPVQGDDHALARLRHDVEAVHEPSRARDADPHPGRAPEAALQHCVKVRDAGTPVANYDLQARRGAGHEGELDPPA